MKHRCRTRGLIVAILSGVALLAAITVVILLQLAKLDFETADGQYFASKNIGFIPDSKVGYGDCRGIVDSTCYYKVLVMPVEVEFARNLDSIGPFEAPGSAPFWWSIPKGPKVTYFRSRDKWPNYFAYDSESGWLFGTQEWGSDLGSNNPETTPAVALAPK